MKTSESIRILAAEIERLLRENPAPVPNPSALNALRRIAGDLAEHSTYSSVVAGDIADKAAVFYSVRRHDKARGGADGIYDEMRLNLLRRIRMDAARFENVGR